MTALVTIHVHLPAPAHATDLSQLRTALVADVLARAVELGGGTAYIQLVPAPGFAVDQLPALHAELTRLWITPPELVGAGMPGRVVHVLGPGVAAVPATGRWYDVASVDSDDVQIHDDPLALRLALLSRPPGRELTVTVGVVRDAAATLAWWRGAVAAWADQPSVPAPRDAVAAVRAALARGLDTEAVLAELRRAEVADLAPGAKFELFAYADRVLGIDLARHLGRGT